MSDSEWFGEPHTLIVHSVTPPEDQFDDGELEYDGGVGVMQPEETA